ncbi:hypothetical protein F5880DRAFT_1483572, partial [Lentinula raphanica]
FLYLVDRLYDLESQLEDIVQDSGFDSQCVARAQLTSLSDERKEGRKENTRLHQRCDSDEDDLPWSSDDGASNANTVEFSPHKVSKLEAHFYYAGVGSGGRGPKLIYRTSDDKFEEPSSPKAYRRLMRVIAVQDSHQLGQNGLWDVVRDQVVELLIKRNIEVSSVDFVRFTWLNKKADHETVEIDEDMAYYDIPLIQPIERGRRHYTNPTIWVGVLPESLTGAVAHESAKDIRALLDSLQVHNVDIAYRESVYTNFTGRGPDLFRPVEDGHSLKGIIDNVSVHLGLPIAGRKTHMEGTLGPYFCVGDKLYAITTRHNLFPDNGDNEVYRYNKSVPKTKVLVMGKSAFRHHLAHIKILIGTNLESAKALQDNINTLRSYVQDGINVQESQTQVDENVAKLARTHTKIEHLKNFYVKIRCWWHRPKDRVIGYIRWAPSIGVGGAPHRYTRDLCVVELYKDKFKHMVGNVISLGTILSPAKLKAMMNDCMNVQSDFQYPDNGFLTPRGILTADQIKNPNTSNLQGHRVRRVLKHGYATNTTVGTLTRYMSFVRKYFPTGTLDSLEVPILSHEHGTGTFSSGGDSGSLVVSAHGESVALLTGGTSKGTITFATPFEYVWDLVKEEFPGANLYFDNLEEFIADCRDRHEHDGEEEVV